MKEIKQQSAFTLLELIIVLTLISLLAFVVSLYWPGNSLQLDASSAKLAQDIRYTQNIAMAKQTPSLITFYADHYQLRDLDHKSVPLKAGMQLRAQVQAILFDKKGIPYALQGNHYVRLQKNTVLQIVGAKTSRRITISPVTGKVQLS